MPLVSCANVYIFLQFFALVSLCLTLKLYLHRMPPKNKLDWGFHALMAVPSSTDLLVFANQWVKDHKFHGTPKFSNLVVEGQPAGCQIATCQRHIGCSKKYKFTRRTRARSPELSLPSGDCDAFVLIEVVGKCDGPFDLKK